MNTVLDSVIIGGGPAGATAAILLSQAGWSVALIEKVKFPRRKVCGEFLSATNLSLLEQLGLAEPIQRMAGPEIRRVGLFAGVTALTAPLPVSGNPAGSWGRALGREHLDTLLLRHAAATGADIWQPWSAIDIDSTADPLVCRITCRETSEHRALRARILIAAHGSWEPGRLLTQVLRRPARPSDLFGFKGHFLHGDLPEDLMPLLVFPGGYGGMVHTDGGRLSVSCCIRRDRLDQIRTGQPEESAAEAVLRHVRASCLAADNALAGAVSAGNWLVAGPIRPGIRRASRSRIFLVGNAAGEAHPVVAEGISMAMQGAWLLCQRLIEERAHRLSDAALRNIGVAYERDWRRHFAPRILAAALFAHLAMRPIPSVICLQLLKRFPQLLGCGARWSGKIHQVVERPVRLAAANPSG